MTIGKKQNESIIISIVRMSQKALMAVLAFIGVGYIGGMIAILFDQSLSKPLADFTQIFIPLFQLEIGVYGLGSTIENLQKIRTQIDQINKDSEKSSSLAETELTDMNG